MEAARPLGGGLPQSSIDRVVADVWAVSTSDCGLELGKNAMTADQIMADVAVADRAAAIHRVMLNVPLSAARQQRLLELLGATQDSRAAALIGELWDRAPALVDRYHREVYEPEVATNAGEPFQVSDEFRANAIGAVAIGALRGANTLGRARGVAILERGLTDAQPEVRAEAIIALAVRQDYPDEERLLRARATLSGQWNAVEKALNGRR